MGAFSQKKGRKGEIEFRDLLRENGISAYRNDQRGQGGQDNPDIGGLAGCHIEVKRREHLSLNAALDQATADSGGALPVVAHRVNRRPWVISMRLDDWLQLYEAWRGQTV